MIELLHSIEVIRDLLLDPTCRATICSPSGPRREEAVGVLEAPRGTLFHHYRVNRRRRGDDVQPDRLHDQQQRAHEPGRHQGGAGSLHRQERDHRGAAEPHRGGHPRLRPLPVVRHARAGADAARLYLVERHLGHSADAEECLRKYMQILAVSNSRATVERGGRSSLEHLVAERVDGDLHASWKSTNTPLSKEVVSSR
jgi:hypothetical protein